MPLLRALRYMSPSDSPFKLGRREKSLRRPAPERASRAFRPPPGRPSSSARDSPGARRRVHTGPISPTICPFPVDSLEPEAETFLPFPLFVAPAGPPRAGRGRGSGDRFRKRLFWRREPVVARPLGGYFPGRPWPDRRIDGFREPLAPGPQAHKP